MKRRVVLAALLVAATSPDGATWRARLSIAPALAQQVEPDDVRIRALLWRIERALLSGDAGAFFDLLASSVDRSQAEEFAASELRPGVTRAVIQERDRQPLQGTLPGAGHSLTVDVFTESGDRGRVSTWQLDVRKYDSTTWLVAGQSRLSAIENLYRLSVNPRKQFDARNFSVRAEDLDLTLLEGSVFTVDTDQGVAALVLLGRGTMRFQPTPETERGQVRIFAGSSQLETRFDAAFVRAGSLDDHADRSSLVPRTVDPRDLKRAEQIFREESPKSFAVDLADLTRDTWSLLPGGGDFLAEIRTRRFDTLTYARSASEAEDISLFERRRQRNIAVYTSKQRLATRGAFYNEDDLAPYDVLDYDISVTSIPEREWIEGVTKMRLRIRSPAVGQLSIRLSNSLTVRSVVSDLFGRLFSLRVANQNTILVNLPSTLLRDAELSLTITYSGRLEPQQPDREALALGQRSQNISSEFDEGFFPRAEPAYLYSNRNYWYPQPMVSDYATASLRITVPASYACVASGEASRDSPQVLPARDPAQARKVYLFTVERPLRYLSFIVSRFARADRSTVHFEDHGGGDDGLGLDPTIAFGSFSTLDLVVDAHPRQTSRGRSIAERAADVMQFYQSIVGDAPYPAFTVALIENTLPGGHSPGYFAVLNQPLPTAPVVWRNDPAAFSNYPEFFLAHEIAHQWWGQAVGWRNYHEQWLSEGFAQYFAALYAQHFRGDEVFDSVLRQLRKWALDQSEQGPVYLGYRVGHIRNDGRAFRGVVYNKGAAVLHMMRRLVGDDAFYRGIRRFYTSSRYRKAGTEDLRAAMEAEAGRPLGRFFERWIHGSTLPELTFSFRVESGHQDTAVVLRFEQTGEIFDLPVTVILQYSDRNPVEVLVPVSGRVVETRVPLEGTLRAVDISKDDGTPAYITRSRQ
jgi:hypothetical protein